ncbi:MAG: EAL domain-containing protein [Pseudomonadota bacterium]
MPGCYLESCLSDGESVYRIPLNHFPALVGRDMGLAVTLQSSNVSRQHAEFLDQGGQLLIRDLGSTNGTFVNHQQITDSLRLNSGDVIRFADMEFRLYQERPEGQQQSDDDFTTTHFIAPEEHVNRIPVGAQQFEVLLRHKLVKPLFQPIMSAHDERITGLELLCRGAHTELPELPAPLFFLAESLGRAVELSELIREVGIAVWASSPFNGIPLFLNTRPGELKDCPRLIESLRAMHQQFPGLPLVLEIHEQAVTDQDALATLHTNLQRMGINIAYDDFGAGQARLLELLHAPPYAVKFDISLIRDIHKVSRDRQDMLGLLVTMVRKGGARALAEGVSQNEELAVCRDLGFDLIQGFVYGHPVSIEQLGTAPGISNAGHQP